MPFPVRLWLVLIGSAASAQVQLDGVRQGYVLEEAAGELRPLIGSPGSAYLGRAIALPFPVRSATVRGRVAVVISHEGMAYAVHNLGAGNPDVTSLGEAESLYLDDSGRRAVLIRGTEIRFVTGLSDTAATVVSGTPLDTGRTVSAATLLDDGDCAIIATVDGPNTRLSRFCASRPADSIPVRLLAQTGATALAYASKAGLFVMDQAGDRLLLIRNPIEASEIEIVASSESGLEKPVGMVAIGSYDVLAATGASPRAVVVSGRAGESTSWLELPAVPDRMVSILPGRLVACSGTRGQPLLVIDLLQDRTPFLVPVSRGAE